MKCQHGNEVRVMLDLDHHEKVCKYNSQGSKYTNGFHEQRESKYIWLLIKGCSQCKTIKFEEI